MAKPEKPTVNGLSDIYRMRQLAERGIVPTDDSFREQYPALFSILVNNRIDEKHWTEPAKLSISNAAGDWSFGLSAPGLGGFTEVLARTIPEGFALLDVGLANGSLKWRFNLKRRGRPRKDTAQEEKT